MKNTFLNSLILCLISSVLLVFALILAVCSALPLLLRVLLALGYLALLAWHWLLFLQSVRKSDSDQLKARVHLLLTSLSSGDGARAHAAAARRAHAGGPAGAAAPAQAASGRPGFPAPHTVYHAAPHPPAAVSAPPLAAPLSGAAAPPFPARRAGAPAPEASPAPAVPAPSRVPAFPAASPAPPSSLAAPRPPEPAQAAPNRPLTSGQPTVPLPQVEYVPAPPAVEPENEPVIPPARRFSLVEEDDAPPAHPAPAPAQTEGADSSAPAQQAKSSDSLEQVIARIKPLAVLDAELDPLLSEEERREAFERLKAADLARQRRRAAAMATGTIRPTGQADPTPVRMPRDADRRELQRHVLERVRQTRSEQSESEPTAAGAPENAPETDARALPDENAPRVWQSLTPSLSADAVPAAPAAAFAAAAGIPLDTPLDELPALPDDESALERATRSRVLEETQASAQQLLKDRAVHRALEEARQQEERRKTIQKSQTAQAQRRPAGQSPEGDGPAGDDTPAGT